jgi:hypothetical protein
MALASALQLIAKDERSVIPTMKYRRLISVLALCLLASGCVSSALYDATFSYYTDGPEGVLDSLEQETVRPEDRVLAAMEEAIALQELGSYAESNRKLAEVDDLGPSTASPGAGFLVNDSAGTYYGELFERVFVHTIAVANYLALQDAASAANESRNVLASIARHECDQCRFPFSRYLAAVSFEAAGLESEAIDVLAEAVAESPGLGFLAGELERMKRDANGGPGFAPPPPGSLRVLYVVLLLGRGPLKVENAVGVPYSHAVTWPSYVERLPRGVASAQLAVAEGSSAQAVVLTDVVDLARASLASRRAALIVRESTKTVLEEAISQEVGEHKGGLAELAVRILFSLGDQADLRHWSTLPESCQVIRATIPGDQAEVTLYYLDEAGYEVDRETLELPFQWSHGALFVTRRMP